MLYVEIRGSEAIHVGAAIAPAQLQPSVPRPADFDQFWDSKLKALKEVPINPAPTPTPTNQPGVELYMVKLDSLGSHVQGYLAKPSKEGKFPALVIFQYAGVYALQKEVIPMIESDHNNITPQKQEAYHTRSEEILNLIRHGGEFKPNVRER
jgi:hypothetical protein